MESVDPATLPKTEEKPEEAKAVSSFSAPIAMASSSQMTNDNPDPVPF